MIMICFYHTLNKTIEQGLCSKIPTTCGMIGIFRTRYVKGQI